MNTYTAKANTMKKDDMIHTVLTLGPNPELDERTFLSMSAWALLRAYTTSLSAHSSLDLRTMDS